MNNLFQKYFKGDTVLWIVFIALCVISIIEMYSASSTLAYKASSHTAPILRHVGFLSLGALFAFGIHLIPYKYIRILSYLGLFASIFLLIWASIKGQSINGAARWITIFGIQFQPSEIGKLSVIIIAADLISRIKDTVNDEKKYFLYIMIATGLICGLILLGGNLSTALLLFGVVYIMMFIGRISWKRLATIALIILTAAVAGYFVVKNTPKESMPKKFERSYTWVSRVDTFIYTIKQRVENKENTNISINDDNKKKGEKKELDTYQTDQAKIAIARGGVFGKGPGNSIQRDYLPYAYSDFIYAIILEETGLVGGIFVIFLYLILLFRVGMIATKCNSVFSALLVIGLALMIVLQAFINMSVATNLGLVTGQPLPLISHGGTSALTTCLYFGIILGITRQLKEEQDKNGNIISQDNEVPEIGRAHV